MTGGTPPPSVSPASAVESETTMHATSATTFGSVLPIMLHLTWGFMSLHIQATLESHYACIRDARMVERTHLLAQHS